VELIRQADVADEYRVRRFGGLTCDFWAKNVERKISGDSADNGISNFSH
jgi:hypothetical protein